MLSARCRVCTDSLNRAVELLGGADGAIAKVTESFDKAVVILVRPEIRREEEERNGRDGASLLGRGVLGTRGEEFGRKARARDENVAGAIRLLFDRSPREL